MPLGPDRSPAREPPRASFGHSLAAGAAGAAAGVFIALLGGRLMAGSIDTLAHRFQNSRLHLDQIGALFGERSFGPISLTVTTALEAALFAVCVVAALILARRSSPSMSEAARVSTRRSGGGSANLADEAPQGRAASVANK